MLVLVHTLWGATSCSQDDPLRALASQKGWMAHAGGPVLEAGELRDQGLWNDPCVIKQGDRYIMYLTSSVKEPFKPPVLPFRAVSEDGISWRLDPDTPLLDPEGTPFASLETPSVVRFKDAYHLFFTGVYPEGHMPPMAVGHARSTDGIRWDVSPEPLLKATGNVQDWNGYLVAEPGAVVFKERLLLYFTALGARPGGSPPQLQSIGLAISQDGVSLDAPRRVLEQSELYPAAKGFVGYSTPSAFVHADRVHLLVDVVRFEKGGNPEWQQVALHHAVSESGEGDFVQDVAPIFRRDDFWWTSGEIHAPTALVEEGQVKLWFGGHVALSELAPLIRRGVKGPEFGIGYATMDLNRFLTTHASTRN